MLTSFSVPTNEPEKNESENTNNRLQTIGRNAFVLERTQSSIS